MRERLWEHLLGTHAIHPDRPETWTVHMPAQFQKLTRTGAFDAFAGETFSFSGSHYQIRDYTPCARPVQQPRPPLILGGGGRRLLHFAGEHANIVSILPASVPGGGLRATQLPLKSLRDKAALVAEAAGARSADLACPPPASPRHAAPSRSVTFSS